MTCKRWDSGAALTACLLAGGAIGLGSTAHAGTPPASASASAPGPKLDISAVRPKLIVLTDGKSHYIVVKREPPGDDKNDFFYGDGKRFFRLAQPSYSSNGDNWERSFIDPRFTEGGHEEGMGFVSSRDGTYTVLCGERKTELKLLDAAAQKALLDAATFEMSPRKYRPYALARDDKGRYYYVDRGYLEADRQKFRLFAGPKGDLKLQKMTNIVSDSQGDVFSTKSGSLRMILTKEPKESQWVVGAGKKETYSKLTIVPIDFNQNVAMIYREFGIYAGDRLGTPCDDL